MTKGKVFLVGAGPGDRAYLTVQAQQLLAQAEVVIYDALVDLSLLEIAPANCLCLDVGKRGGHPSPDQETIDALLVEYCQQGRQVVRLKSGDPFIFGRCLSEIQALKTAGCEFAIVPGLSSALAAPLLAGIPLTDAALSQCFAVLSAHDPATLDWQALARIDALVILMGTRQLPEIVAQLQQQGRSPQTPIAVIRWGGHSQQQIWRGTLSDIMEKAAGSALSPAVIVIGAVAQLQLQPAGRGINEPSQHQQIDAQGITSQIQQVMITSNPNPDNPTFRKSPGLAGKTILVTRAAGQSGSFSEYLQQVGARVIEMPALEIGPPSSWAALDAAIAQLQSFDWLIFTSANGVHYFFERLHAQGLDARSLAGVQIAVVGKKTAASLTQQGLKPDLIPPDFVADALVAHFPNQDLTNTKILFPRVETGGRDTLVAELSAQGAAVVEVPAYESGCPPAIAPAVLDALQTRSVDIITFASSKTVQNFCHLLEQAASDSHTPAGYWHWLENIAIASIGPQTSETCRSLLGRVDIAAATYTLKGLTQAIIDYYYPRS